MHEEYYGFAEKPFSLTPDPKYLYKSESHANAFDLLQYAIRRREGFVVVTGDIGTGKTTLCRAVLEQLDRKTFTALVLNPFLTQEDLLRLILQDFGVVSRDEIKRGRLVGVSKQELIDTLNEFLLSLLPLGAGALLIIDEAQNLTHQVLEQIRILSNLETDKEKLLQIVLVGQLNLKELLRSAELRQLDQRVSIRYELKPLSREETAAYVSHRLTIAGGGSVVSFAPKALDRVHKYTGGIPRVINLLCDRALLGGYSARSNRITPEIVLAAAARLELAVSRTSMFGWVSQRAGAFAAGAALMGIMAAATWYGVVTLQARSDPRAPSRTDGASSMSRPHDSRLPAPASSVAMAPSTAPTVPPSRETIPAQPIATTGSRDRSSGTQASSIVPPTARATRGSDQTQKPYSVLVGSFRQASEAAVLAEELQGLGYQSRTRRVETEARGTWHEVLVGPYGDLALARRDEERVRQLAGYADARLTTR
ncbi:MAG: ral secretion pathway protein [Acidobacteriota bacterium]|jgi:general secretion pathway protein A